MHSSDSAYNLPPFPAYPSIDRFVGLGSVQDAMDRIERSIQARDAISVVIGPPGTGKTLISELLASRHQQSHRVITLGETPLPDSDSFLRRVLHQAGADIRDIPGDDLQLALFDHICLGDQSAPRILLLIDEAQSLSPELLETIRTLTNLTRDGAPRVSVVMFGGNHLDELLIAPSMDGFRQRISTRCYLHPLNNEETGWYINQTIRNCGCDPDATITADAISAVHHACSGVPRLINQLLTHAIEFAADKDEYLITDRIIDQAWAEVQQLPSPMVDEPEITLTASTVEFGELDSFDAPSDSEEKNDSTDNAFDSHWADTNTATGTATDTGETESDAYDSYDFEPDGHVALSSEQADSAEFHPGSELEDDTTHDLHTEVWDDGNEIILHERLGESSKLEIVEPTSEAIHEDLLDIDDIGSPRLQYPQLASPALATDENLETNENLETDAFSSELSEDFAKTQTSAELFGSFDEEEELDLQSEPHRAEMPTKRPAATIETVLPQEIVIHQEIIGISELIQITEADQIQYCDDAHQMPNKMHHETSDHSSHDISFEDAYGEFDESSVDTATLDFVSDHHGNPTQLDATEELADLRQSTTDPDSTTDKLGQHAQIDHEVEPQDNVLRLRHDDSDMLIIEDEVDIHRIDKRQSSVDASHQSIDYQRMLKRMRSKS